MGEAERARLEEELTQHYASVREAAEAQVVSELAVAMVAEDARAREARPHRMGMGEFVAFQVRYIPVWTWAVQVALVVLMCALAHAVGDADSTKVAVGILSAMSALAGAPTVQASRLHGVAELEYACLHDTADVLVARLIALGCSSALSVVLMVVVAAPTVDASAFELALWACPPFLLACAGSLMALRRTHPATSTMLSVAWAALCSVALPVLAGMFPDLYADTSLVAWASAAVAALVWMAREVMLSLRTAAAGLDSLSPQLARTYD